MPPSPALFPGDAEGFQPFQSSVDGNAASYVGDPSESEGSGHKGSGVGNEFIARRGAAGWQAVDATPSPGEDEQAAETQRTLFEAITPDFGLAVVGATSRSLARGAIPAGPVGCKGLYARNMADPTLHALFSEIPAPESCGFPFYAGASADGSALVFQSSGALVPEAVETSPLEREERCDLHCNLYDSGPTGLSLVNRLPDGTIDAAATFGGSGVTAPEGENNLPDFSAVLSSDGSRAYWSDANTGVIYLRTNPSRPQSPVNGSDECLDPTEACSVEVSGTAPAQYWTATPDGRYAYYTESGQLWRFDSESEKHTALTPAGSNVQGVIGINETGEDGRDVYLVAGGALAPGATARACEGEVPDEEEKEGLLPPGRGCNLYLLQSGTMRFIAAVAASDDNAVAPAGENGNTLQAGDWQPNLGLRTAAPTMNGESLVFESTIQLTGYDNRQEHETKCGHAPGAACAEIYDWAAQAGSIGCASCLPDGHRPFGGAGREDFTETMLPTSSNSTVMRRWISSDGNEVFFDTGQPLVTTDQNGVQDVYEWQRGGTAGCPKGSPGDGGCVYLLSGGTSSDLSFFTDASESGDDVFFVTRTRLVPADHDERMELYDARTDGGLPQEAQTGQAGSCEGGGCRGVPSVPPSVTSPMTLAPLGNTNYITNPIVKPPQQRSRCKKGYVRKGSRCVRKPAPKCKNGRIRRHNRCVRHGNSASSGRRHKG